MGVELDQPPEPDTVAAGLIAEHGAVQAIDVAEAALRAAFFALGQDEVDFWERVRAQLRPG